MKKLLTLTLTAAILVCAFALSASAAFDKTRSYDGQFDDVSETAWYAPSVKTCYEMGLISGQSQTTFNPQGMFTVAQALTVAARMHNIYGGGDGNIPTGNGAWYSGAVDYCIKNGIVKKGEFSDYSRYITRAEMAGIMVAALPNTEWKAINNISVLPDVENNGGKNENAVFTLYNAGILAGSDEYGKFQPNAAITRAEVAALIVRMADKSARISVNLKPLSERKGVVIPGDFNSVTPDGRIIFRDNNGYYGVMNVDGSIIFPAKYESIQYLENGKFELKRCDAEYRLVVEIADASGKVLYTYDNIAKPLGDEYYLVGASYKNTGKLYNGNTLLASGLSSAERFGDYFVLGSYAYYNGDYQYPRYAALDKNGKILVDYDDGEIYVSEDYIVRDLNRTYTFYDKSGNLLCEGNYNEVSYFNGFIVFRENGKEGLATPYGKVVDAMYDNVSLFFGNTDFAVLHYGDMQALAGKNGIIFDLGKYNKFSATNKYALALRNDGLDLVDVTGDIVASAEGGFNEALSVCGNLICFGYMPYKGSDYCKNAYNFAYDTESGQVLKYQRIGTYDHNYESFYANDEKCILMDGTEVAEVKVVNRNCLYKSLDGKYGIYFANRAGTAEFDTPEEAINGNTKPYYRIDKENGKQVVKYGDEVVIKYAKEPFYYDRITELGYNNYYICTFNNINYIIHP